MDNGSAGTDATRLRLHDRHRALRARLRDQDRGGLPQQAVGRPALGRSEARHLRAGQGGRLPGHDPVRDLRDAEHDHPPHRRAGVRVVRDAARARSAAPAATTTSASAASASRPCPATATASAPRRDGRACPAPTSTARASLACDRRRHQRRDRRRLRPARRQRRDLHRRRSSARAATAPRAAAAG